MNILSLVQTALELGLICSLTVLALFLSYYMRNVCDLSTDGCFTLGAAVGAMVAIAGHPYLTPASAMGAGPLSRFTGRSRPLYPRRFRRTPRSDVAPGGPNYPKTASERYKQFYLSIN